MPSLDEVVPWLLDGEPWLRYAVKRDLLDRSRGELDMDGLEAARDPRIQALASEVRSWPWPPLSSHKSAAHPLHKLAFLSDLGIGAEDLGLDELINMILATAEEGGPFQVPMVVPKRFGGSGMEEPSWALCDAPLLCYALVKLGQEEHPRVKDAVTYLRSLVRPNGWPCAVAPNLGRFRGPGRQEDLCPYANLVMLKLLAEIPALRDGDDCRTGADAALGLWSRSWDIHPYMFYMGTDFRKLKAPLIWYDLLHVTDVLTRFPWLRSDPRLVEMVELVASKADREGRFTPESIWLPWKGWDLGQKKVAARSLTFLAWRALNRMGLATP